MIRALMPTDADAYVALRAMMLVDSPWAFGSSPGHDRFADPAVVAQRLTAPGLAIVGAFEPGLVSVAGLHREEQPKRAHIATVWGVFTAPATRRRGLSRRVLAHAIELAGTWPGLGVLQLAVNERSGEARALYESLGFRPWGVEPDALRINGVAYAETHMVLAL